MEDSEERERGMEQEYETPQPISRKSIGTLMYQRCVRTSDGKTTQTRGMQKAQRTQGHPSFIPPSCRCKKQPPQLEPRRR